MNKIKSAFFNSKKEDPAEKAFKQSIATSVCCILLCLIALCSATWAWFSESVNSRGNNIQSASCAVSVLVEHGGTSVTPNSGIYSFAAGELYNITLTATGSASTAYCIFISGGNEYYTAQISTAPQQNVMAFTIEFNQPTDVEIIPRWGTSSKPDDKRTFADGKYYLDWTESILQPVTQPDNTPDEETTMSDEETTTPDEETTTPDEETTASDEATMPDEETTTSDEETTTSDEETTTSDEETTTPDKDNNLNE